MRKLLFIGLLLAVNLLLSFNLAYAQCAMCKQNVTNSEEGIQLASGLNDGIIYLLVVPYLIFAGFAVVLYVSARKQRMKKFHLN